MRTTLLGCWLSLVIAGCSGRPLASYGERCTENADCSADLICAATNTGTICASTCEVDGDCTGAHGPLAYCDIGGLACLQACDTNADCDGDTTCMEGFCEGGSAAP